MNLSATALAGQARRLVQRQDFGVFVQHKAAYEGGLGGRELDRVEWLHPLRLAENVLRRHGLSVPDEEEANDYAHRRHRQATHNLRAITDQARVGQGTSRAVS